MTRSARRIEYLVMSTAGLLVAGSLGVPALEAAPNADVFQAAARQALTRIADRERSIYAQRGHYEPFGPTQSQRQAAIGSLHLDPAADDLSTDAHLDPDGRLHLRALITVDAVRQHGAAPAPYTLDLPAEPGPNMPVSKVGQP